MRFKATASPNATLEEARQEAIRLCRLIDGDGNAVTDLVFLISLEPVGDTKDGKTEIELTVVDSETGKERRFLVRADTGK
jgi:hypothetical protein